jgi:hypothetical protein
MNPVTYNISPDPVIKCPLNADIIPEAQPYWDLVVRHGTSRESMVDFICSIGGYHRSRGECSAIEFGIKAYGVNFDADHLWAYVVGDSILATDKHYRRARQIFEQELKKIHAQLWQAGCEEALNQFMEGASEGNFLGEDIDVKFEVAGRSGGHLLMVECEGIDLRVSVSELRDHLLLFEPYDEVTLGEPSGEFACPDHKLRKLFLMCVQSVVEITPKKVREAVESAAAFRLWHSYVEPRLEADANEAPGEGTAKFLWSKLPATAREEFVEFCAYAQGLLHPLQIGHKITSIDGESDWSTSLQATERRTGPNAVGKVVSVDLYEGDTSWHYGVTFPNGTTVILNESDLVSGAYEWEQR